MVSRSWFVGHMMRGFMKRVGNVATWVMVCLSLGFLSGCASGGRCNTDSCYREQEQVDAYENGEVVAWGVTEKQNRKIASEKARDK
jgi:hypothetical protein